MSDYKPPSEAPPVLPDQPEGALQALPIVVIDYSASKNPETRSDFLSWLRLAVSHYGHFYLINVNEKLDSDLLDDVQSYVKPLFNLSESAKAALSVDNSPHFYGYTGIGHAFTSLGTDAADLRETFEFGSDLPPKEVEGDDQGVERFRPGPNLWPDESDKETADLNGFKENLKTFNKALTGLALELGDLIAESIGLNPGAFEPLLDEDSKAGGRVKFLHYPAPSSADSKAKGEGAHRDMWLTFTIPVEGDPGFVFLNESHHSILVPFLTDTIIVSIGSVMETATNSALISTPRRILSPPFGEPDCYSIVFQMDISSSVQYSALLEGSVVDVSSLDESVKDVAAKRRANRRKGFEKVKKAVAGLRAFGATSGSLGNLNEKPTSAGFVAKTVGEAAFYSRIKSRPEAAKKWYPVAAEKYLSV